MEKYQREFIEFALEYEALKFGEFTLKSGRNSPYFFNTGVFNDGRALRRLGEFYAHAIAAADVAFDMLYGPAYKGIPLGSAIAIAYDTLFDRQVPFAFNRKEAKDHGEGGIIMGAELAGRVTIVDDVISAGTSVNESVAILAAAGATPVSVTIALDRQEVGAEKVSAIDELKARHGLEVTSIVKLDDILNYIKEHSAETKFAGVESAIEKYREKYGT